MTILTVNPSRKRYKYETYPLFVLNLPRLGIVKPSLEYIVYGLHSCEEFENIFNFQFLNAHTRLADIYEYRAICDGSIVL
jgi:hypothetical protein